MKRLFKHIICIMAIVAFVSCDTEETSDVSRVTTYAVFEYDPIVVIPLGGAFEPSAIATENGGELQVTTTENVNTNVVGIYDVVYSATNSDGFEANAFQTVVVHDPSIVGNDVSGAIYDVGRPERTGVISLVEGTTSIFYCTDFGFSGSFPMYFQMDGDVISEIPQNYTFDVESVDLTYDPVLLQFTTFINPQGFDYTFKYQ
ncbi:MAG: DUF5011 domain-containing protein [Flavobacteriaceae bacterium]|nr:DUF5011 domain-containing protein [Mangrovimonas sp.]MCB0469882.1 DUF5011 domain-containing protein [Flavobacteriaceae bacterium]HPF97097.1 DUF5011 domain-containing protein [Mangrovimonas sp.]HRV54952.1 DUF5011 domain-containing protein [Mangrovimonas sp.]